jgi:NADH-quinone oxidoreductase subunit L
LTNVLSSLILAQDVRGVDFSFLVPALTALAAVLCGIYAALRVRSRLPAWTAVGLLGASFVVIVFAYLRYAGTDAQAAHAVKAFDWINFSWRSSEGGRSVERAFVANFAFYLDGLTLLWMLFVTGLGTLIALYASEYMSHDLGVGYCRFFAAFCLFVFSMACLVMADNFLLLYLGWEGVGLCSYLLIGYFYQKPSAVAAAKKAFIVNRIGDLFLALGIMLIYVHFGSVEYATVFAEAGRYVEAVKAGNLDAVPAVAKLIPLLLIGGAFGKSAQLPLYVWLPDAMEGPTPVSALIHAATMVTAGVFLVARAYPLFLVSDLALHVVAWVGALTALLAATIGMSQFDIKRIMAYSTVSQLGYMFAGMGVLTSVGGAFHVFTHAFFKAMLFLACGAVMHGFAGQLDLRRLSGLGRMPGWRITTLAMLVGCLNLAGFPVITAGYWSKDMILGQAFANPHTQGVGWVLLLTAGLTAYYTFRVFFRVFMGPVEYELGDEHHGTHGEQAGHGHARHAHDAHEHHDEPHAPGWAINSVLALLAISAFAIIPVTYAHAGWVARMVDGSTARLAIEHAGHATFFGHDPHQAMMVVSGAVGLAGIGMAWWLHLAGRTSAAHARADSLTPALGPIAGWARGKWYVDEFYDFLVVRPLWTLSRIFHFIDQYLVDGLVDLCGAIPRMVARSLRPVQNGELHNYAAWMAGGLATLILIVIMVLS